MKKIPLLLAALSFIVLSNEAWGQNLTGTKEAFTTSNVAISALEIGQTFNYRVAWQCSFVNAPPPQGCGDFEVNDILAPGLEFVACSVTGDYSCNESGGAITIDKIGGTNGINLGDGDASEAAITVRLSTDPADYPGGIIPGSIDNTVTITSDQAPITPSVTTPINTPTNNWEIGKSAILPRAPLSPATDNDIIYQIELCPNGPLGLGIGTTFLSNPVVTDVCDANATFVSATFDGLAITPSMPAICPSLTFTLPIGLDPSDGCRSLELTLQYTAANFSIGDLVNNTATGTNDDGPIDVCSLPCTNSVDQTISAPTPDSNISKGVRRSNSGLDALNQYNIGFNTQDSNVLQTNVFIEDIFPTEIVPIEVSLNGWDDETVIASLIELPSNTVLEAAYDGSNNSTQSLSAAATGIRLNFISDVPPGFNSNGLTIRFRTDVAPTLNIGDSFQNCATIDSDQIMVAQSCANVSIVGPIADIRSSKSMPSSLNPSEEFTARLRFSQQNTSSLGTINPSVTDCLPAELEFVSWDDVNFANGLDDPRDALNTGNTSPVGVMPNLQYFAPGDAGNSCTTGGGMLRFSWLAAAPAGSIQVDNAPGVNNAFTFPAYPDRNNDNLGNAADGDTGLTINIDMLVTLQVRSATAAGGPVVNRIGAVPESGSFNCISGGTADVNDIDKDTNIAETICAAQDSFSVTSTAAYGASKFIEGFAGLPNIDPINPPTNANAATATTPAFCPQDPDGRTRTPCIAQAMADQPFNYRVRLSNDGNVAVSDYVAYDIFPYAGDVGVTEAQVANPRGSSWTPQLLGPLVVSSANATVQAELTANAIIEYSASSDPCRPELSLAADNNWQSSCVDDWTEQPLADGITFPDGYASVRAWRLIVPFASGWPLANQADLTEEDIVVDVPMLAQQTAPRSDYDNNLLEIAWNNIGHRGTNDDTGLRLLAAEARKSGIAMPADFPVASSGVRIGNLVWSDDNNDGVAQDGEAGLFDVSVQLWEDVTGDGPSADDVLFDQQQTDALGNYLFDDSDPRGADGLLGTADDIVDNLGMPVGDYYVVIPSAQTGAFVLDDNYSSTGAGNNPLANDDTDNDDNGAIDNRGAAVITTDPNSPSIEGIYASTIMLTVGGEVTNESVRDDDLTDDDNDFFTDTDSNVSVDFGFYRLRLGNHIWLDEDNDGVADSGEPAIANMQAQLFVDDGDGLFDPDLDQLLDTDTTDVQGQYLFDGLDEGAYFVVIPDSQLGLTAGGDSYSTSIIQSSTPTSVAGSALAADNDDDGASGIFGSIVPVSYASVSTVLNLTVNGAGIGERDTSNNGITGTSATDVNNRNVELNENIAADFAFPDSNSYLTADFGFVPDVSLGSTVWVDSNGNGVQNSGEGAIAGATVTLLNSAGSPIDGNLVLAGIQIVQTTTDADGQYNFNRLVPSIYRISVDLSTSSIPNIDDYLPTPTQVTTPNNNNRLDSNIDYSADGNPADLTHISAAITLLAGTEPSNERDPINSTGTGVGSDPDQPNQAGLTDNAGNMTLDMGFVPPVSLGSTVWFDDNDDGLQTVGEAPIVGATITLLNPGGSVFDSDPYSFGLQGLTVVTDSEGQYNFDALPAGSYRVQVNLSSASNANAALLVPTPRQVADPDAAGPGLNNNTDSNINTAIDSNVNDQIHFSGIITLEPNTEPAGESDPIGTPGADQPNQGLSAADDPDTSGNMTVDFGFIEPVSLGSTVWFDSNGDGLQSASDVPISGALATLLNADGSIYDSNPATAAIDSVSVSTDAQGQYNFNGLPEGDYRVQLNLTSATSHPGAMLSPTPRQIADPDAAGPGQDNNTDSNVDLAAPGHNPVANIYQSGVVSLTIGGEPLLAVEFDLIGIPGADQPNQTATEPDGSGNMTVDMGFFAPVSLGSTIWNDTNANGNQDAAEPAIQGAIVTLLDAAGTPVDGDPNILGVQLVTDVTDADGQYNFDGLLPGNYRVQVDLSAVINSDDYLPTPLQVADPDALGNDNTDSNIDTAFDTNVNDLIHTSGVITLSAGGEPVGEADPIGVGGADQPNQGLTAQVDPDASGNMTVDMGFIKPVSLGSTAWLDINGDGLQDVGEPPIVAAGVTLLNANGTVFDSDLNVAGVQALTVATDAQGQYNFDGIPEGDYRVQIDLASATNTSAILFVPTPTQIAAPDAAGPGFDNNNDSNIDFLFDPVTTDQIHTSGIVTLTVGGEPVGEADQIGTPGADQPNQALTAANQPDASGNMTVDFGFIEPVSLGSTVWFDSNTDGNQDDNEPPILGALVTLLNSGGTVYDSDPTAPGIQARMATTDATGQYNFNGLPAGSYSVQVDLSAVAGSSSITPTPIQVLDPENNINSDSNIATVDQNGSPADTSDDLYRSGVIILSLGGEPENEVDPIDAVNGNGPVADQPGQAAQIDSSGNMTVDFGFFQPVSLGSTIWEDLNGDGEQNALELPIEAATVTLLDAAGVPVTGVSAVLTNADGEYNFDGLLPGDYRVQVDLSTVVGGADLIPSPVQVADPDLSGDPSEDSNDDSNIDFVFDTTGANVTTDQIHTSGVITLAPGTEPTAETDSIGGIGPDQPNQDTAGVDPDAAGNMTLDMGFVRPVSLGSTIWQDENGDGIQDDGEPPILNATVTLLDAVGAPIDGDPYTLGIQAITTVTDSDGQYFFNELPPGDYRVQVDLATVVGGSALIPAPNQVADPDAVADDNTDSNIDVPFDLNLVDQIHTSGVITLTAGGEPVAEVDPVDLIDANGNVSDQPGQTVANPDNSGNMTVDMGFYAPVSVGSFVWQDNNGDGLQDAGEPPLAGSLVTLLAETAPGSGVFSPAFPIGSMAAVPTVTVGPDGLYEFTNLPPGNYKVRVTPAVGFFPSPVQNATNDDDTANDSNIASESVIQDVVGRTAFESGVFEVTSGGEPNEVGPDANRGDRQDGAPNSAEDLSGNMTIDFGFVPPASLGNYVWLDLDMDGVQDANEDGIANVTVNLYQDTNSDGVIDGAEATTPVATVTTGPNGGYIFNGLQPGVAYQTGVDVSTMTPGLVQTFDENDGVGATDSLSGLITLDPNEFHETADFGYAPAAGVGAVGDTIWVDANDNGLQDPGEPGIANVVVSITPAPSVDLGAGPGIAITTVTDSNGKYLFPNLPLDQTYIVEVDIASLPLGYVSGPSNLGDPDVRDGNSTVADDQTTVVITAQDPINLDLDFGYLPPAGQNNSVGDTIWIDLDRDGEGPTGANSGVDATEQPVPGVTVNIVDSVGSVVASTVTDANGQYLFTGLPDGQYSIIVTDINNVLSGLEQTYDRDDGATANPLTLNQSTVNLDVGGLLNVPVDNRDQDFGYVESNNVGGDGSIGDTIFFDENNSGLPEPGEGLEGVTVQLFGPGPDGVIGGGDDVLIGSTITDENGNYLFTGLDTSDTGPNPGTEYQVVVVPSSLPNGGSGWSNSVDPDSAPNVGDNESITTLTVASPIDLDQDFGYISDDLNSLSGTVWPDTNGDGELIEDGRFSGVTVELRDQNGNLISTTRTDANGDFSFENLPDGIYMVVVTDDDNILSDFEHTDSPNGLTDKADLTSKDDTGYIVDLDSAGSDPDPVTDTTADFGYKPIITNPISLGAFLAASDGEGSVVVTWATQTEVANIGFNLYGQVDGQWKQLNAQLVIGLGDSVSVQSYDLVVETTATTFALSDIDLTGKETLHGPFDIAKPYGFIGERQLIDWKSEKADRDNKQAKRLQAREAYQSVQTIRRQLETKLMETKLIESN
ncbi:MAG: protocatechuate 3,4-dioxygenase beta subunit [Arenicella sp.]|jgi:protocatechuate 3,4-dioxygenase beta subunit